MQARFLRYVILASMLNVSALAQSPGGSFSNEVLPAPVATFRRTVDEVNLAFTVTDKRGRFISNLQSGDFDVFDNRKAPERMTYFQQKTDLPLHVAVVIDASASVRYRFKFEQDAAVAFLKKIVRQGTDKALILAFNDRVITLREVTDRSDQLRKSIGKIKPEGNTALNDAVIAAAEKLRRIPEDGLTRRAIVLISDGVDTVDRSTLQQAEQAVSRADAILFALTTNSERDADHEGDAVLKQLAQSSGGALLPARKEEQFTAAFRNVEKALRNQYVVSYNPAEFEADGSYRTVQVIPRKPGLRATCRKGYYAGAHATR